MKILVTGFEPFDGERVNPSSMILDFIAADPDLSLYCDVLRVPVTFEDAHKVVLQKWRSGPYAGWIGFGQAGGRGKISLERVALNWKESSKPDNAGVIPEPSVLVANAPRAHFSSLDLQKIESKIEAQKIPTEISFSAGAYVCNSLYFHMMQELVGTPAFGVFVHVPYLPEQLQGRQESHPSMKQENIFKAAKLILFETRQYQRLA